MKRILKEAPNLARLRLSSINSVEADADLLDAIADEPRLMPHLRLSLQAGDDLILKRMKRRHSRADAIGFCQQIRRLRPNVAFGADIIAGFPTEDEDMFRAHSIWSTMWPHPAARLSVLAAPRHAGCAHAEVDRSARERARPPLARKGRGGAAPSSRCTNWRAATRADGIAWTCPHRTIHARAACGGVPAGQDAGRDGCGTRRPPVARGLTQRGTAMAFHDHLVTTMEQLQALYGEKMPAAIAKEINFINSGYRKLIEAAPFVAIATGGPEGLDCSPKGDAAGFVRILDDKTLAIPTGPATTASMASATSCAIRASHFCSSFRASARPCA